MDKWIATIPYGKHPAHLISGDIDILMTDKFTYKMKVAKSMAQKGNITVPTKMPEVGGYASTLHFNFTTCIKQYPRKQYDLLLQSHYSRKVVQ